MIYPNIKLSGNEAKTVQVTGQYISCAVNYETNGALLIEAASDNGDFIPLANAADGLAYIGGMVVRQLRFTTTGATGETSINYLLSFNSGFEQVIKRSLVNIDNKFQRVKTEMLTAGQDFVLNGVGFESNWVESTITTGQSRFAEFTIPSGYKMVLAHRHLNPSGDHFLYRVYPSGAYTFGAAKTDDAHNFAKTRNLRQDSGFAGQFLVRKVMTTPPAETAQIIYEPVWGSVNAGNRSVGSLDNEDSFLLLTGPQTFALEMKNAGTTNSMSAQVGLQYAFVPDSQIPDPLV